MKLYILITINLCINCFLAGGFFEEQRPVTRRESLWLFIVTAFLVVLGLEGFIVTVLYGLFVQFLRFLARLTQIPFYWKFYLTKQWDILTEEQWQNVDRVNEVYSVRKKSLIVKHVLFTISLVYKRHNHIFKTEKQYKDEDTAKRLAEFDKVTMKRWFKAWQEKRPGVHDEDDNNLPKHKCGAILPPYLEKYENSCHWCGEDFETEIPHEEE